MVELDRFKKAQEHPRWGFDSALSEINSGEKRGHWIWYIFPQLSGLGSSSTSRAYAIQSLTEAREYLRDPLLRGRLLTITRAVLAQLKNGVTLTTLMGWDVDALKLVSSLTLFSAIAKRLYLEEKIEECSLLAQVAEAVLDEASLQEYSRCKYTLSQLGSR